MQALPDGLDIEDFELGPTLGTGSFSRVRIARFPENGSIWAIKTMKKSHIARLQQAPHVINERNLLMSLNHPFVANLAMSFQDDYCLHLVLEFAVGGELLTHLRKAGQFHNNTAKFYAAQVLDVISYLHSENIIYRDLKPENVMVGEDGYIKMVDFGLAKRIVHETYTICGTPEYLAPEMLTGVGHGRGVDWWAFGVFVFELLAGETPFQGEDIITTYQQIKAAKFNFTRHFDRNAKSLVKKLLLPDLARRLGCHRSGAEDVRRHKWFNSIDWNRLRRKELESPLVITTRRGGDTSNFDPYPDSDEEPTTPVYRHADPFEDF